MQLRDNHPTLAGLVEDFFEDGINSNFAGMRSDFHEETTKEHDRNEVRRTSTSPDLEWLPESEEWVGMKSLICVESRREVLGKQESLHRRYTISGGLGQRIPAQSNWRINGTFRCDRPGQYRPPHRFG